MMSTAFAAVMLGYSTVDMYEDPEKSIVAGIDGMVKLIKRSKDVLDAAAEKALLEA